MSSTLPMIIRRRCLALGVLGLVALASRRGFAADPTPSWNEGKLAERVGLEFPSMPQAVAFSPDGRTLVAVGFEHAQGAVGPSKVRVWGTDDWKVRTTFEVPDIRLYRFGFGQNGTTIVAGGLDGAKVLTIDLDSGRSKTVYNNAETGGVPSRPASTPDGTVVATAGPDGIKLWDSAGWFKVQDLYHRDRQTELVATRPENWRFTGGWLHAMDENGIVTSIVPVGGARPAGIRLAPGMPRNVGLPRWGMSKVRGVARPWSANHLTLSADGKLAAFVAIEEETPARIDLYDVVDSNTWKRREAISVGDLANGIYALEFTPDGKALVAGCSDSSIKRWDVETRKGMAGVNGLAGAINDLAFSPDGTMMASADMQGRKVQVWSPR